jgi:hypothetical protein
VEPPRGLLDAAREVALLLLLAGCAKDWENADLQLDVTAFDFADDDRVRICVDGVGEIETAAGAGRIGFLGLPEELPLTVTVDRIADEVAVTRAGPLELDALGWTEAVAGPCEACEPCEGASFAAEETAGGWLLAVRLLP